MQKRISMKPADKPSFKENAKQQQRLSTVEEDSFISQSYDIFSVTFYDSTPSGSKDSCNDSQDDKIKLTRKISSETNGFSTTTCDSDCSNAMTFISDKLDKKSISELRDAFQIFIPR